MISDLLSDLLFRLDNLLKDEKTNIYKITGKYAGTYEGYNVSIYNPKFMSRISSFLNDFGEVKIDYFLEEKRVDFTHKDVSFFISDDDIFHANLEMSTPNKKIIDVTTIIEKIDFAINSIRQSMVDKVLEIFPKTKIVHNQEQMANFIFDEVHTFAKLFNSTDAIAHLSVENIKKMIGEFPASLPETEIYVGYEATMKFIFFRSFIMNGQFNFFKRRAHINSRLEFDPAVLNYVSGSGYELTSLNEYELCNYCATDSGDAFLKNAKRYCMHCAKDHIPTWKYRYTDDIMITGKEASRQVLYALRQAESKRKVADGTHFKCKKCKNVKSVSNYHKESGVCMQCYSVDASARDAVIIKKKETKTPVKSIDEMSLDERKEQRKKEQEMIAKFLKEKVSA